MKLPNQIQSEIFLMRISAKNKQQLLELSKKGKYGSNSSEVVRYLIETAYLKM